MDQALSCGDVHEPLTVWEDFNNGRNLTRSSRHRQQPARRPQPSSYSRAGAGTSSNRHVRPAQTWAQIGDALGITKPAAHDVHRRRIEEQEKHLPDLHDAAAAHRTGRLKAPCTGMA